MKRKNLKIKKILIDSAEMTKIIDRMVYEMIENLSKLENVAIVGIRTRGVTLAERIVSRIEEIEGIKLATGTIDIALYRDDFFKGGTIFVALFPLDLPEAVYLVLAIGDGFNRNVQLIPYTALLQDFNIPVSEIDREILSSEYVVIGE